MQREISRFAAVALLSSMWLCCCEQASDDARPPATTPQIKSQTSPAWLRLHDSAVVAVNDPAVERELKDATAEAHRTLPDARQRWSVAKPEERALWAVKWAAPLAPRVGHHPRPGNKIRPRRLCRSSTSGCSR
jgi:hypothetical protein